MPTCTLRGYDSCLSPLLLDSDSRYDLFLYSIPTINYCRPVLWTFCFGSYLMAPCCTVPAGDITPMST